MGAEHFGSARQNQANLMNRRDVVAALAAAATITPMGAVEAAAQGRLDQLKLSALMGGDFATITSQLALRQASSRSIRNFAELEIAEQAAVAAAFGSRPGAAGLTPRHEAMVAELRSLRGPAFDRMYVQGQIVGHRELLTIHTRYARVGRDPMARGASMVGVTGIQTHLAMLNGMMRA
jgi:putative membrane protein